MNYETLITENKKEANYDNLQKDLNKVEQFIEKCLNFVFECSSATAERDFNVTSL